MKCPYNKCNGSGFLIKENSLGTLEAVPCECRKEKDMQAKIDVLLTFSRIPKKYLDCTFESYREKAKRVGDQNKQPVEWLEEMAANPHTMFEKYQIIWIYGTEANAGHTTFAVLLGLSLIRTGVKVRFITMHNLLTIFTDFENKSDILDDLNSAEVYILDDAFDVTRSYAHGEYTKINLFHWLNASLNDGKKFICTSNTKIREINSIYDQCRDLVVRAAIAVKIQGSIV